jgi:selenocysteine lyase/cysteine desulfurase
MTHEIPTLPNCQWSLDCLRDEIDGLASQVQLLDGRRVSYVYLDNGASTPSFRHVNDVVREFMPWYSGVHRGTGYKSILATRVFDEAHELAGEFVGADKSLDTVIFGKNTTEVVNKLANRCDWRPDDVVITTFMEHHSNDLPWRKYAKVVHLPVDDEGFLIPGAMEEAFARHAGHVRFLAVTGASNITGIVNPIHDFAQLAHRNGVPIFVDAAQLAPHRQIDMRPHGDSGHIDFIAYSAHKMYAPFGIGVLIGSKEWFAQGVPDMVGGGVVDVVEENDVAWSAPPAKEEAGSPNVPGAVALAASIHMLMRAGMDEIATHEYELVQYAIERMKKIPGLVLYGPTRPGQLRDKVGVISFNIEKMPHALVAAVLSAEGAIGVRNGCFCAHPYVKRLLKVDEAESQEITREIIAGDRSRLPGMVRASFGCYNNFEDVDRLTGMLQIIASRTYKGDYVLDAKAGTWWPKGFEYDFAESFPHFSFRHKPNRCGFGEAS